LKETAKENVSLAEPGESCLSKKSIHELDKSRKFPAFIFIFLPNFHIRNKNLPFQPSLSHGIHLENSNTEIIKK
jgi:hypothetical protein